MSLIVLQLYGNDFILEDLLSSFAKTIDLTNKMTNAIGLEGG